VGHHGLIMVLCALLLCSLGLMQASCKGRAQQGTAEKPAAPDSEPRNTSTSHEKAGHNRLIHEKSPYLLQHADNPVDWYPWGEEAFEKARQEDKPIFLSIGYSTCHWCHVMEHESFEDPEVGRRMNEVFVSIKVDREERPDIDNIYMTVCQMMTGQGGWPLTVIMTPEKKPFFAGTYFPREARFGRSGILELIARIEEAWKTRREDTLKSAEEITAALQRVSQNTPGEDLGGETLGKAYQGLSDQFDERYGGFGTAHKFPEPSTLLFMLRYWKRTGEEKALRMVEETLQAMRQGGIYDHVGYGFHRYATDARWTVPHFEKMLYDQAQLAMAYTEAYQATGRQAYARTAREIFTYVLRDMRSPEGGFYAAEDADSEGEEGKFYLWRWDEVGRVLSEGEADLFRSVFSMESAGNFVEMAEGSKLTERWPGSYGKNILYLSSPLDETAEERGLSEESLRSRIDRARQKLLEERSTRIHPHKDDKILADWNGLMIAALAKAARALDEPAFAKAAKEAAELVLEKMRDGRGRLLHRYREGEARIPAMLTDYAFMAWGMIELYEATFETRYLRSALSLTEDMQEHFWDEEAGGFFLVPDDGERQIVRRKRIHDTALPSGNSVAALNLLRLGRMTGSTEFEKNANRTMRAFSQPIREYPSAFSHMMSALSFGLGPNHEVIIVGDSRARDTKEMVAALGKAYAPNKVVLLKPTEKDPPEILELAPYVEHPYSFEGRATAYVCTNHLCKRPTTDIREMLQSLETVPGTSAPRVSAP